MEEDLGPTMEESSHKDRPCIERQLRRIHVLKELPVKIELEVPDGRGWSARCIDIHIGGVLLEFAPNNTPDVNVDSEVLVTIQLDSEIAAKIPAIIRHFVARRLGLEFPDLITRAPELENHLSHIVRNVEREMLRKRTQD